MEIFLYRLNFLIVASSESFSKQQCVYNLKTGRFTIADNGKGMGSSHESSESFGMGLIQTFVKAMGASLSIDSGEYGTVLHIVPETGDK